MIWHVHTLKPGPVTRNDGAKCTLSKSVTGWSLTPDDPTLPSHEHLDVFEICEVLNQGGYEKGIVF